MNRDQTPGERLAHGRYRNFGEDGDGKVWAAPNTLLFIERMHAGRIQTIALDPAEVEAFVETLRLVRDHP